MKKIQIRAKRRLQSSGENTSKTGYKVGDILSDGSRVAKVFHNPQERERYFKKLLKGWL